MDGLLRWAPQALAAMIVFVAYGSQILFRFIEPGPLDWVQFVWLNSLVGATWICFARACFVDPGRVPKDWRSSTPGSNPLEGAGPAQRSRWCKRCDAPKPPRAHHCKTCKKCVPKMDHHCPWTANCVAHRTIPHFMRLLFYSTASMTYIEYLLLIRGKMIWDKRTFPSYLGPSAMQLALLFVLLVANSLIYFVVGILFARSLWGLSLNITTIESWEIDRHKVLLRRARVLGGYLQTPNGGRLRISKQEFPYDVGIWTNINQSMNGNIFTWLIPFSRSPGLYEGIEFPVNGFEDAFISWPPPDPDRITRVPPAQSSPFTHEEDKTDAERLSNFKLRQAADIFRIQGVPQSQRRRPFHQRFERKGSETRIPLEPGEEGEEAWQNSEGERLRDFGVDEGIEFYDEDELPLAQLIERKSSGAR